MIDNMDFGLNEKCVLVTGISGQLGTAIAQSLLNNGAYVIGIDKEITVQINELAKFYEGRLKFFKFDITKKDDVDNFFGEFKEFKIDHLINNAGVSVFSSFWERTEEEIDWVLDVNLKGTFYFLRGYLKHIKNFSRNPSGGSVVNIASHYGVISPDFRIYTDCPRVNSEIYGATKAGVIQLTKYFAVNAASLGVRVNSVSPGGILNDLEPQGKDFQEKYSYRCPMGRLANVNEVVGGILFLISPAASYINGHNLIIDGGMTAW